MSADRAKRSEVAKLAGVSEATVSFVFSKKRFVSEERTKKVLEVAKKLDYQPDLIARSMVTKTTETIAVLTNDIASPLQMEVIKSIQKSAMAKGFFVNVCGGTSNLERYIDNFIARRVDGVFVSVVVNCVSDDYIKKMLDKGISVIIESARRVDDDRICGVELDFVYGMNKIVEYLSSLQHTKIAYLSCFDDKYVADKRLRGFRKAMKTYLNIDDPLIIYGVEPYNSDINTGRLLAKELLDTKKPVTAVICSNDLMAMGAISAFNEAGLNVPRDISVVGIDDIVFSKAFTPSITTISHQSEEYGAKIFDILYSNIIDRHCVRREIILPDLIIRNSTAVAKEKL